MAALPPPYVPPPAVIIPVPIGPPAQQRPPGHSSASNVCNPTPPAQATPGNNNVCNPTPPAQPKPANVCDNAAAPKPPVAPKPNSSPLTLKPNPRNGPQVASAGSQNQPANNSSVQACESKPPFLPWGGTGSATITVSGGKSCSIGWHDTGATILDSMSVTSSPSHGSLKPQDQHVIIFTPASGYKGQDSFSLVMQEHNAGRSATLRVNVSVTIQ